jgi:hypothetical protein
VGSSWATSKQRIALCTRIVEEYSPRKLTDPEDRLNALAGVANELRKTWNDDYMYGLWKGCIIDFLTWSAACENRQQRRSTRAPSWSWASRDSGVRFNKLSIIDAMLKVPTTSFEQGQEKLFINCRILSAVQMPISGTLFKWVDLLEDESSGDEVQYLLAGAIKRKKYWASSGLMVAHTEDPEVLRRIGYFEILLLDYTKIWHDVERQNVIIVQGYEYTASRVQNAINRRYIRII